MVVFILLLPESINNKTVSWGFRENPKRHELLKENENSQDFYRSSLILGF